MAFDDANAAGGINGRKIKYIVEDMQYQVPRAVQAANKLINRDNVFVMVSNGGTPMNNATMPEQIAKGVPNIFPLTGGTVDVPAAQPHEVRLLAASYYDMERAGVKLFVQNYGKKRICAMSQDTDYGRDVMDGARDQLKAMNMQLVAETLHKPTDTDFSAAVAKLRDADCDLILLGTIVRDTVQIVSAIRRSAGTWISWATNRSTTVRGGRAGRRDRGRLHHDVATLYVDPGDPRPAVHEFATKYERAVRASAQLRRQIGYSAAQVVVLALQKAGRDLTADSFIAALESIKDYHDIFGSPTMNFSATKHQGSNEAFLAQVKDGHWVQVGTESYGY